MCWLNSIVRLLAYAKMRENHDDNGDTLLSHALGTYPCIAQFCKLMQDEGQHDVSEQFLPELARQGLCDASRQQDPAELLFNMSLQAGGAFVPPSLTRADTFSVAIIITRKCVDCGRSQTSAPFYTGIGDAHFAQTKDELDSNMRRRWVKHAQDTTAETHDLCCRRGASVVVDTEIVGKLPHFVIATYETKLEPVTNSKRHFGETRIAETLNLDTRAESALVGLEGENAA